MRFKLLKKEKHRIVSTDTREKNDKSNTILGRFKKKKKALMRNRKYFFSDKCGDFICAPQ